MPEGMYKSQNLYWWGAAMLGSATTLMGVAQCGYVCGKKVLQYTMVPAFLGLYYANVSSHMNDGMKHRVMSGYAVQIFLSILACYVIEGPEIKAKRA